jgi:hypothetical protein
LLIQTFKFEDPLVNFGVVPAVLVLVGVVLIFEVFLVV